jgi:hypothetical protein
MLSLRPPGSLHARAKSSKRCSRLCTLARLHALLLHHPIRRPERDVRRPLEHLPAEPDDIAHCPLGQDRPEDVALR